MPGTNDINFGDVDPKIKHFEKMFRWSHLATEELREQSRGFAEMAQREVLRNPEGGVALEDGLRKLWEAKNSFVAAYATR